MYKAVALDLDGTILTSKNQVTEKTKRVLTEIRKMGIKVIIATGRTLTTARPIKDKLELEMPLITNNGSRVYNEYNQLLKEFSIPSDILNEILKLKRNSNIHLNIYSNEKWYVEKDNFHKNVINYQKFNNFFYELTDFDKFLNKEVTKLVYMGKHEELVELEEKINNISPYIKTMFSTEFSLEVINAETSKAAALLAVLDKEQIKLEETIAFGDGFNDYEMLKSAGKACIMGNAHYKLKESLPEIEVIGTNDDESVAEYLGKIFNI